jgi:hypothetical protein
VLKTAVTRFDSRVMVWYAQAHGCTRCWGEAV